MSEVKRYNYSISDLPDGALGMPESVFEHKITEEDLENYLRILNASNKPINYVQDPRTGEVVEIKNNGEAYEAGS